MAGNSGARHLSISSEQAVAVPGAAKTGVPGDAHANRFVHAPRGTEGSPVPWANGLTPFLS